MTSPILMVIMVDGWRARSVGAYGNSWYSTPELDRLASQSLLLDQYLAESASLTDVYDSLWTARHAIQTAPSQGDTGLLERLSQEGYVSYLITDEPVVADHSLAKAMDEIVVVPQLAGDVATDAFDTSIGKVFEAVADAAGEWAAEYEQPRLLWAHLQGFHAPWDAPREFSESLLEEDDPELPRSTEVPQLSIEDPEEVADASFLASCRYAGQVRVLDRCLGALDRLLQELWPETPPTIVLGGTRGFALGEHGIIGRAATAHSEHFHVPLLIRSGDQAQSLRRKGGLVQTSDLARVLASLAGEPQLELPSRQLAVGRCNSTSIFLRTSDWHFVRRDENENSGCELYVKPDDLWEANDVASLCPEEINQFEQLADEVEKRAEAGEEWRSLKLESTNATGDGNTS